MNLKVFNGPHLVNFSKEKFIKEVKHLFSGPNAKQEMEDIYALIKATYGKQPDNPQIKTGDEE